MPERSGHRGYIGARPLNGSRTPQHVQNIVIRDYAKRKNLQYLLSAVEHIMPGSYMIRLTVDGKSFSAPLIVKMDPRIKTSPAGLLKKFQVETRLALLLSESAEAVGLAGSIHEQLEKLEAKENSATDEAREAFEKKLKALQGGAGGFAAPPSKEATLSSVNGEAGTLYQQVWGADAEPTSSQMQAIATTERESEDVLKRWNAFKNTDLPAFNRALHEANVPEIKPEVESLQEETQIDED